MKLNCWLVRNAGLPCDYYFNLSTVKPQKTKGGGWKNSATDCRWIFAMCTEQFEHWTKLKLPPGGIMPITLSVERRTVGKILWPLKKKARKKK